MDSDAIQQTLYDITPNELPVIERLAALAEVRRTAHSWISVMVVEARKQGLSWQAIGDALGVTRQAAQQWAQPRANRRY